MQLEGVEASSPFNRLLDSTLTSGLASNRSQAFVACRDDVDLGSHPALFLQLR